MSTMGQQYGRNIDIKVFDPKGYEILLSKFQPEENKLLELWREATSSLDVTAILLLCNYMPLGGDRPGNSRFLARCNDSFQAPR